MAKMAIDANSKPIQVLRPTSTVITQAFTGTAATASAIGAKVRVVRLVATEDCHYSLETTATTSSTFLPAGMIEYIHVFGGETISVIQNSVGGTLFITEME